MARFHAKRKRKKGRKDDSGLAHGRMEDVIAMKMRKESERERGE